MLDIAKTRLSGNNHKFTFNIKELPAPQPIVESANLQELQYPDESFDRVYGNFVLHLVPDPGNDLIIPIQHQISLFNKSSEYLKKEVSPLSQSGVALKTHLNSPFPTQSRTTPLLTLPFTLAIANHSDNEF